MGFLAGNVSCERYWITSDPTPNLGMDHLKVLKEFKIGTSQKHALEQPFVGFLGGDHLLDTEFDLEKNVIEDALHFSIRIDTDQIPAAIRKAWLQLELAPLTADNPSGKPTKAQREQAKEAVEARCEEEAASGRFRRLTQIPILWDAQQDLLYVGSTSSAANELCLQLLQRAFDLECEHMTASSLAKAYASEGEALESLYQVTPAAFVPDQPSGKITWWNGMAENFDFLGNEFLLWLWWYWETQSETVRLQDDTNVAGIFQRSLTLDCPLGESGKETISAESPVVLPEASLAVRSGKLPRRAGLCMVRDNQQYDLTLQAESFTVSGAKISALGEGRADRSAATRVHAVRELSDTLDFLFEAFCERRIGAGWASELKEMQAWLRAETPQRRKPAA